MKRIVAVGIAALGGFMLAAWGIGEGEAPPSHGTLPSGHPPMAWSHPALPQGHPPLDAPRAVLPPGHPPIPSTAPRCPASERKRGGLPYAGPGGSTSEGVISI